MELEQVTLTIRADRCPDTHQRDVHVAPGLGQDRQAAGRKRDGKGFCETCLVDGWDALAQEREPILAGLDQVDAVAQFGEADGGDEPDIACADDEDR